MLRQIGDSIKSGELKPGASLPSTQSLGKQLGISPETVRQAYIQLRDKKLITREDGLGYQVRGSNAKRPPTVSTWRSTVARVTRRWHKPIPSPARQGSGASTNAVPEPDWRVVDAGERPEARTRMGNERRPDYARGTGVTVFRAVRECKTAISADSPVKLAIRHTQARLLRSTNNPRFWKLALLSPMPS
ncbi:MAG: winged helix-turn-helix domain-containing protein [Gammaproteobacteria bacterium]